MEEDITKFKSRNSKIRKIERIALVILVFATIPLVIICYFISFNLKILTATPPLLALTALIQLEVCGLFEYMNFLGKELERIHDESNDTCTPSNLSRQIFEFNNPEPGLKNCVFNQLYLNKRVGFYLLVIGSLLQLSLNFIT